jgi:hypothetical protein
MPLKMSKIAVMMLLLMFSTASAVKKRPTLKKRAALPAPAKASLLRGERDTFAALIHLMN